jgi:hypothetical protein
MLGKMWALSLLPDMFWHLLIAAGAISLVAAMLLKNISIISKYKLFLQFGGGIAVLAGVWMVGNIYNEAKWQARVKELESKVAAAEEKSKEENVKVVTKVVTKREYYRERGNDVIQYVDREIIKYDNTCPVPKEVVKAHNDAAAPGDKK